MTTARGGRVSFSVKLVLAVTKEGDQFKIKNLVKKNNLIVNKKKI
jgi:hypothetical protein